ncbi:PREDICTED: serum amyloid A-5 protein-like [Crocodylus porosus]|uniref:Serum amyloid A protein n=1 Tax=Crocodylus porosus TaxID=8502 RepID=A0A7M4DUZ6_CROPO|nr:PREDICTED: serum amyloid A-5 protein-like [Crocodylus porosus]
MKFFTSIFLLSLVLCVTSDNWAERAGKFLKDTYGGATDMARAYKDMREANWKNSDKYFHARGNRDAARRGPGGAWAARVISDARDFYNLMRGRDKADRRADQEANRWGRNGGDLKRYRPRNLPRRY